MIVKDLSKVVFSGLIVDLEIGSETVYSGDPNTLDSCTYADYRVRQIFAKTCDRHLHIEIVYPENK